MRLKTVKVMIDGVETEVAVVKNGMPVYVHDDNSEVPFDAPSSMRKIGELNTEAKNHRLAKEAAETKLEGFKDITDPAAALAAINTVKNLDTKKLIDAGEVEKVKQQVASVYEEKIAKLTKESTEAVAGKDAQIYKLVVSNEFAKSPLINGEKALITLPPDIAEATFGKHFKIEDGKMVAYLGEEKIFSKERAGELANFDEALSVIVDKYPMKDRILRGTGATGTGSQQTNQHKQTGDNSNLTSTQKIAAGLKQLGG